MDILRSTSQLFFSKTHYPQFLLIARVQLVFLSACFTTTTEKYHTLQCKRFIHLLFRHPKRYQFYQSIIFLRFGQVDYKNSVRPTQSLRSFIEDLQKSLRIQYDPCINRWRWSSLDRTLTVRCCFYQNSEDLERFLPLNSDVDFKR